MNQNSYFNVIKGCLNDLHVPLKHRPRFQTEVNKLFVRFGILDWCSLNPNQRNKPLAKSPYGEFVEFEERDGKRVHVQSFILNDKGKAVIKEVFDKFITDNCLTDGRIKSADPLHTMLYNKYISHELLISWLKFRKIPFKVITKLGKDVMIEFKYLNSGDIADEFKYFYDSNLIVAKFERNPKTQKSATDSPFWFIYKRELKFLKDKADKFNSTLAMKLCQIHWLLKFKANPKWTISNEPKPKKIKVKNSYGNSKKGNILSAIEQMVSVYPNNKRYKTVSLEQIAKEKKQYRKERMQAAYNMLKDRRLLTAKYIPADGWKFDFDKSNVELLYRIDDRKSTVCNTRHRLVNPFSTSDGKIIKEIANKGETYHLPWGLEKLDYSFPYIFVMEGAFDSCFVKNGLAYFNWCIPAKIDKVLDIYRQNGFTIVHCLDNFRIDNGGSMGLTNLIKNGSLTKGDLVYNWSLGSKYKDFNDWAIAEQIDEIPYQDIINNTWNEKQCRNEGLEWITTNTFQDNPPQPFEQINTSEDTIETFLMSL